MAYTNAIFYMDYVNGSDTARIALTSVAFTNSSGLVFATKVGHGLVTGAVVDITSSTSYDGAWKITWVDNDTFTLDSSTYSADRTGTVTPRGGQSWTDAWKTITSGSTSARIAAGDKVRMAKSPDPTSVGITAKWTDKPDTLPTSKAIVASSNASPINVQVTSHGYSTGDIVYIYSHATNLTANGMWRITYVDANNFTLDGSIGIGTGSGGTSTKINHMCAELTSAPTAHLKTIDRCEVAWTAANSSTVTKDVAQYKEGYGSAKIVKSSPSNNTLYAYKTITSTDYSAYQKISFWIYNATAITAGQWNICLCSDTSGASVVDTFAIPAIPSINRWLCLTILSNSAGNLGSTIQSVALYSGASAGTTAAIYLDNILACTTSGLNLQSLISKNTLAQGSVSATGYANEGWYAIQGISEDGKILRIDNVTNTLPSTNVAARGWGYSGTTETVDLYYRETIKTNLVSAAGTAIQEPQASGSAVSLIEYQGGYDTSSSIQNGETHFDALNGFGYGIYATGKHYIKINYLGFVRAQRGLYVTGSNYWNIPLLSNITACEYGWVHNCNFWTCDALLNVNNNFNAGIQFTGDNFNNTFTKIVNLNNNWSYNLYLASGQSNTFTEIVNCFNANSYNIYLNASSDNIFNKISAEGYSSTGFYLNNSHANKFLEITSHTKNSYCGIQFVSSGNNTFQNCVSNNGTAAISSNSCLNFFNNVTFSDSSLFSFGSYYDSRFLSTNHGGSVGAVYIGMYYGNITSDTTNRHTASGICWKLSPTNSMRDVTYPVRLKIATIACNTTAQVTVKAWVKKSHATDIGAKLCLPAGQLGGPVTNTFSSAKADDTSYEELTLTFNPTAAGVFDVEVWAYWQANTADESVYVDDMTITQA